MMPEIIPDPEHWGNPPDPAAVQAARIAELVAALREARDSLLDIRDLSAPYDCRDNPPGFELSRIFSHAEYGLHHSEAVAKQHGMERGKAK